MALPELVIPRSSSGSPSLSVPLLSSAASRSLLGFLSSDHVLEGDGSIVCCDGLLTFFLGLASLKLWRPYPVAWVHLQVPQPARKTSSSSINTISCLVGPSAISIAHNFFLWVSRQCSSSLHQFLVDHCLLPASTSVLECSGWLL